MVKRTFGWVQNPGDLKKLKKVVSIFQPGSVGNLWLIQSRLPLLLRYALISHDNYDRFVLELSKPSIDIAYSLLKGKGAGSSGRKEAICTGIVQAVIDAQQSKTYTDGEGNSIMIKKPYTDDWSAEGYLRWGIFLRAYGICKGYGFMQDYRVRHAACKFKRGFGRGERSFHEGIAFISSGYQNIITS